MEPFRDVPVRQYRIVNAVPVEDHNAALDRAEAAEARVKELEAENAKLSEALEILGLVPGANRGELLRAAREWVEIFEQIKRERDERWVEVRRLKVLCRRAADSYPNATRETGLWDQLRDAGKE